MLIHTVLKKLIPLLLLVIWSAGTACSSSATGAGPLSIPAPTTSNIRATSPNSEGLVRVDGSAGAVEPEHLVEITNTSAEIVTSVTTTADATGAFSAEISAEIGDSLSLVAIHPTTEDRSPAVEIVVPENMPSLNFNPRDLVADNNGQAYVLGLSGDQAVVAIFDLAEQSVSSSFDIDLTNPRQIALDPIASRLFVTDPDDDIVLAIGLDNPATSQTPISVDGATSIAVDSNNGRGWVGTEDTTNSIVVFDTNTLAILATQSITHAESAAATYTGSPGLNVDDSGIAMIVSLFDDESSQVTAVSTDEATILVNARRVFEDSVFRDIISQNTASVVVTDSANDRLLIVDPTANIETVEIEAGNSPEGIVEDAENNRVFVSNKSEHTASVVDLTQNIIVDTFDVGLEPTSLVIDSLTDKTLVVGSENDSLTILDSEDLE